MFVKECMYHARKQLLLMSVVRVLATSQQGNNVIDAHLLLVHLPIPRICLAVHILSERGDAQSRLWCIGAWRQCHEPRVQLQTHVPSDFEMLNFLWRHCVAEATQHTQDRCDLLHVQGHKRRLRLWITAQEILPDLAVKIIKRGCDRLCVGRGRRNQLFQPRLKRKHIAARRQCGCIECKRQWPLGNEMTDHAKLLCDVDDACHVQRALHVQALECVHEQHRLRAPKVPEHELMSGVTCQKHS